MVGTGTVSSDEVPWAAQLAGSLLLQRHFISGEGIMTCASGDGLYPSEVPGGGISVSEGKLSTAEGSGDSGRLEHGVFHEGVSIDLIFRLRAVAFSAAENSMPASCAFISASPGGSELLLLRRISGLVRGSR
jgi:hypothetical protein